MRILSCLLLASASVPTALATAALPAAVSSTRPSAGHLSPAIKTDLTLSPSILDPENAQLTHLSFSPSRLYLQDEKPIGILKEPHYLGKPEYGAFRIGDGPRSVTYFAIDDIEGKDGRIYVDFNQNGDLTDDVPVRWDTVLDGQGRPNDNTFVTVHASWGNALKESESGECRLLVAHKPGQMMAGAANVTARVGRVTLAGKIYPVVLAAESNDGIFTVPADGDLTRSPVLLYVDNGNDAPIEYQPAQPDKDHRRQTSNFNITHPFLLGGQWYLARPSVSGAKLAIVQTASPLQASAPPAPSPMMEPLASGTPAPNFTVQSPDGKPVSLADFKGKTVVLDFWATWCGPCQVAMPGLEKLYQSVKDQNVVFLSVNVLDDKNAFDRWIQMNAGTNYHFTFGYDPAGKSDEQSVATAKYKVFAIPHVFVISREGIITASLVGSPDPQDLRKALVQQGIQAKAG